MVGAASVAALGASAVLASALAGCATAPAPAPVGVDAARTLAVESVHLSAAGNYVDLRYRVLDPARATAALGAKVRPILVDEATGREMAVPTTAKLGSLRQTQGQQRTGRTYFVLFINSARVGPGSRVTAVMGDLRFPHLTVE